MTNFSLRTEQDDQPESPREWDNLGTIICDHSKYNLGDEQMEDYDVDEFGNWDDYKNHLNKEEGGIIALPVYLYDHSDITISTEPFSCSWDSGQVGIIYVTLEEIRKEYDVERVSKKLISRVLEVLKGEIKVYDQYLVGDVYGYIVEDENGDHVDSCWGFFGEEHAKEEGTRALAHLFTK